MTLSSDRCPQHGRDGWSLERYSWDKKTGTVRLTYEKDGGPDFGGERRVVMGKQLTWSQSKEITRDLAG